MPTYLVRIIETRDLVGFFSADSVEQLILTVDECTEPDGCEYARLSVAGGIMWTSPAIPVPIEFPDDSDFTEPDPMPWSEATVTERWWNYLHGYEKCRWKPFFPESPPKSTTSELTKRAGPGQVVPFRKKRTPP